MNKLNLINKENCIIAKLDIFAIPEPLFID